MGGGEIERRGGGVICQDSVVITESDQKEKKGVGMMDCETNRCL